MNRKLLLVSLLATMSLGLVGCGGGSSHSNEDLYICVYDGGYGTEWIKTLAQKYEEKTGVKVHYEPDQQILDRIEDQLQNGSDYDIIMSHDINWQSYAKKGWLTNLDDLYSRTVEGTNKTFEQRLVSSALPLSKTSRSDNIDHYYKVCYTQGAGGLVYNIDMFNENGWSVPTTYDELKTLCQTIVDSKISAGEREYVKPFTWAGNDRQYYWDYLVFEWWAQLAGMTQIDKVKEYKGDDGKYSTGYQMYNPDTNYAEFKQAYQMWYDLIASKSEYSISNAYAQNLNSAKADFVNGKAAMIPYAQWAKYELEQVAENNTINFNFGMMKTPKAKADSKDVNYMVGFGDSMIIPSNAVNVEGAKDFLAFMATDEACSTFVEKTEGAFLAFDYSDINLTNELSTDKYINSVYKKLTETTDFTLASTNPITYLTTNCVMPWVSNTYYYAAAAKDPSSNTPVTVAQKVYETAKSSWSTWVMQAHLTD